MKSKVVVISTGGTIAMRFDAALNGMVPAVSGFELIEAVPPLKDVCDVDVVEFANIPSAQMTPAQMLQLAQTVETELAKPEVCGVVITHGTDTVEETAYFLELYTTSPNPICLTAAMRTSSEVSPDGPNNILSAVRVACDAQANHYGVMVVMNNEIHAACDVTKMHTGNVKTFASPSWGPIGYVDNDRIVMHQMPRPRYNLRPTRAHARVPILKAYTGMDALWVEAMLGQPLDGLVIEGFGRGNFPPVIMLAVQLLIDQDVPVVVTSRVPVGRVLDVYAAVGAGGDLKKRGAILAGELSAHKARLKLIMALGVTRNAEKIKALFEEQACHQASA